MTDTAVGRRRRTAESAVTVGFALMASLTVLMSMTAYSVDSFLPAFPLAAGALEVSASSMQLTLSAFLIGIAVGQLFFGPMSDRLGRRGPLLLGIGVAASAAIVAALSQDVTTLIIARFIQGVAGSSGTVISRAIIRDRTVGDDTARALASLAVGMGVLNIFSPLVGGTLVEWFGWRGPLWFIATIGILLFLVVLVAIPETHERQHRTVEGRFLGLGAIAMHMRNRAFLIYVITQAGSYTALMAYVSSSPFVYQQLLGFDQTTYGLLFAMNAAIGVGVNFVGNHFMRGLGAKKLVLIGLGLSVTGATATILLWFAAAPSGLIAAAITLSMAPLALNGPNLVGLALNRVSTATGSAAATIGFVQFCAGSAVAPFVGLWGFDSLLPMCLTQICLGVAAIFALIFARYRERALDALARSVA